MENIDNISFEDTSVAFSSKSNKRLRKMYLLFWSMNYNRLIKVGNILINFLFKIRFPVKGIIKYTVFEHFCGGETIFESKQTIQELANHNVGTILDYSVEGEKTEEGFESTTEEILRTIENAKASEHIPFSVFKVTGIASLDLLAKIQSRDKVTPDEEKEFEKVKERVEKLCRKAFDNNVGIFIDAEETWIQDVIDQMVYEMMEKFNKEKAIVYNTYQMYRADMLENLRNAFNEAEKGGYYLGAKLVRGAYMEKERDRAEEKGYPSPIHPNKEATDNDFNEALEFCLKNKHKISLCSGSHNEYSNIYLTQLLKKYGIGKESKSVYFSQLYGMSDNISFNLAKAGYNVVKYVPYGPVKSVMPYLYRRSQENSSVAGQTSREFGYIRKEMERRKNKEK